VDIHQRIRLELREVWAVWRRELARFDEAGLSAAERTARLEQLQRRSLAVLAGTANGIEASGSVTDEIAELTKLRAEIDSASSGNIGLPILEASAAEPEDERRPSLERPTGPASGDRHQRQP